MTAKRLFSRRLNLPAIVFAGVLLAHFAWLGFFPEKTPAQDRWVSLPTASVSWLTRYVETRSYWLGFSYGLTLAFAATAFRRYRERQFCTARHMAIGGVTLSGVLSVAGCYLLGCCGSPMLAVYLNLFGATFIPFAKPLMFVLTAVSIGIGWWWMKRREALSSLADSSRPDACGNASCACATKESG